MSVSVELCAELDPAARAAIGPRRPGGIYRNGYLNLEYRVEAVLIGESARTEISFSDFALVERDLTGPQVGRRRVHCTAWNDRRDEVVAAPPVETQDSGLLEP